MSRPKGSRSGRLERDPELADRVVAEYQAGASLHWLSCTHKVSWAALRAKLVERGVQIRRGGILPDRPYDGPHRLTDEEVARLRARVGFTPPS